MQDSVTDVTSRYSDMLDVYLVITIAISGYEARSTLGDPEGRRRLIEDKLQMAKWEMERKLLRTGAE